MRGFFTLLLCLFSFIASAKDYYISSTGNDSSDGLSSSTPWRTISKVNAASSSFNPGDRILFKRNDVFYGTLKISKSGLSGNPITISSYGSGNKPIITGFTTINEWTNNGNGIYSSRLTSESVPNIVTVNGVNTPIGRWPNTGFLSIDSHNSNSSITDSELPSSPDWTGGEVVIRKVNYIYDRNLITSHSGTTLYYKTASDYTPRDGYGYFIQSHIRTLDRLGEWYSDGSTFYMYFGTANPADYVVKVSTLDQLVSFSGNNHILVDNLSFEGGNKYGIQISNSGYITIQNCSIKFTGGMGIYGPWTGSSPYCRIINNTIDNNNNNGIELNIYHTNAIIQNNYISNSGIIAGMGRSGDGTYIGMISLGANSLIQNNIIENSGYIGIHFHGNNTVITQNLVNTFNLIKNDGGGIYTYTGTGTACTGRKVTNNIVLNGKGYGKGVANNQENAHGIYIDDRTSSVVLTDNTVAHCNSSGMYIHNAHELEINRNTLFDNGSGNDNYGSQILFIHDSYSPNDPIKNVTMNNNIFFARYKTQVVLAFCTNSNDISSFGSANYNCYARPLDNSSVARTWSSGWNSASVNRSLSNWQSFTGQDRNSYISPLTFSDPSKIRFEYNASTSNRVVSLNGSYIDVKGTKYDGSITLAPYTSAVLMVDPNPSAPPAVPAYVSSEIKDGAPSILEMTYNLSLANIVPAASSFSVQVNSAARSVSSVSVSGTKVLLTLSSPVAYGNTVTVAYNKPSTNPLQTPAGGQAATISAQSVTNRIAAPPPPPAPVYVSSVVENTAPSVIEITYNLALANIVPAVSAFTVQVNSTTRSISTVSVSGTKVLLSLAIPVAYGNTVTVAYTKPSTNPLQTAAGGQAATISAQSVTNRISQPVSPPAVVTPPPTTPNSPPVPVVNFPERTYSGFIGDISAKGSYDPDMDKLSFSWKTPDNIPVSSNTGEAIQFLAPVIDTKQTYEFALTVSDGKTTQTKTFPITIIPYEPYLEAAEVISVSASDFHSTNHPYNVVDGNITTMWSSKGEEQSLILELKSPFIIHHIKIAFQPGQKSESYFDIYGSNDGENWESILKKAKSCSFSGGIHVFVFPLSKAVTEYSYLKFVGLGNSTDNWNYVSELRIFGYRHKSRTDYEDLIVKLFPNPARDIVNIRIDDPEFNPDFIKILGLDGKIIYSDLVEPGVRDFQIPVNFKHGVYIVQMGTDNITMFTQKLVVSR